MNFTDEERLDKSLRKIRVSWLVTNAVGAAIVAYAYGMITWQVARDPEVMGSIRQALQDHGIHAPLYGPIGVYSAYVVVMLCLALVVRRLILRPKRNDSPGDLPRHSTTRLVSRYGSAVSVSSIVASLIPAGGIPLLLFTGAENEALVVALSFSGLSLILTAPRSHEFFQVAEQWNQTVMAQIASKTDEAGWELPCTGMNLGSVRAPGGKLTVRQKELVVRSFMGLLGEYRLRADEVLAFHVKSSNWITGLQIRIEHGSREVPPKIILGFDSEPEDFFLEIASAGFKPLGDVSKTPPNVGLPVRMSALVVLTVLWNSVIMLGILVDDSFMLVAMLLLFGVSFLMDKWPLLATWVMKPGRDVSEITPFLLTTRIISAIPLALGAIVFIGKML